MRRSEHGMTKPFICRGEDGEVYFVKGTGAGRISQINEWVSGNLALAFGIPVAPFRIVQVPEELAEVLSVKHAVALGYGPAFGSKEQQITELAYSQVSDVPIEMRCSLFVFDWWISNGDRMLTENGGNPNLFWEAESQRLVVIDHNQSFDPDFDSEKFFKYHAFKDIAPRVFDDLIEREHYTSKMENAIEGWEELVRAIPEEWLYRDPEMTMKLDLELNSLLRHLQRFRNDSFWSPK
ncbi:HipA domain-containing protein [Marinobacter sp. ANT_B65]|uniref:HipA domain-containing protein n=1 Tax=Marinobacter sp. ANT_B65 TaxID=2039467 RepID=UPI001D0CEC77|nr:HipA domain-containing protein [Marinobacter sp. ANT_B65]